MELASSPEDTLFAAPMLFTHWCRIDFQSHVPFATKNEIKTKNRQRTEKKGSSEKDEHFSPLRRLVALVRHFDSSLENMEVEIRVRHFGQVAGTLKPKFLDPHLDVIFRCYSSWFLQRATLIYSPYSFRLITRS